MHSSPLWQVVFSPYFLLPQTMTKNKDRLPGSCQDNSYSSFNRMNTDHSNISTLTRESGVVHTCSILLWQIYQTEIHFLSQLHHRIKTWHTMTHPAIIFSHQSKSRKTPPVQCMFRSAGCILVQRLASLWLQGLHGCIRSVHVVHALGLLEHRTSSIAVNSVTKGCLVLASTCRHTSL